MKNYNIIYSKEFQKLFKKLDKPVQKLIASFIKNNLENCTNPRIKGKALVGNKKGFWRYRIADYRLIVEIIDDKLIIIIITIGHRSKVYKS
jgi:addiction module toxin, RelE/StbE family